MLELISVVLGAAKVRDLLMQAVALVVQALVSLHDCVVLFRSVSTGL